VLLAGLRRLEYRGYDSAGIALFHEGKVEIRRSVGKLNELIRSRGEGIEKDVGGVAENSPSDPGNSGSETSDSADRQKIYICPGFSLPG